MKKFTGSGPHRGGVKLKDTPPAVRIRLFRRRLYLWYVIEKHGKDWYIVYEDESRDNCLDVLMALRRFRSFDDYLDQRSPPGTE